MFRVRRWDHFGVGIVRFSFGVGAVVSLFACSSGSGYSGDLTRDAAEAEVRSTVDAALDAMSIEAEPEVVVGWQQCSTTHTRTSFSYSVVYQPITSGEGLGAIETVDQAWTDLGLADRTNEDQVTVEGAELRMEQGDLTFDAFAADPAAPSELAGLDDPDTMPVDDPHFRIVGQGPCMDDK